MRNTTILIICTIFLFSCKEEIILNGDYYSPLLVIDGKITNEDPPYTIELSRTAPLDSVLKIPFTGCNIMLIENDNRHEELTEVEPGIYKTSNNGIQGVVGNYYKIEVTTPDGRNYETENQVMSQLVQIDSVYAEFEILDRQNYLNGLPGYQFYVDTKTSTDNDCYLLWDMIETYKYNADYPLWGIMTPRFTILAKYNYRFTRKYTDLYTCWITKHPGYLITAKTTNLTTPVITGHPLHFVGTDTKKLQIRYSLLLKQYSIDKNAYEYWSKIEERISNENFLVATQPYNIIGNLKNADNPDETVLGYFTVASITEKRTFVDRPYVNFYYDVCNYSLKVDPRKDKVFLIEVDVPDEFGEIHTAAASVDEDCIVCTSEGGDTIRPPFWVDQK